MEKRSHRGATRPLEGGIFTWPGYSLPNYSSSISILVGYFIRDIFTKTYESFLVDRQHCYYRQFNRPILIDNFQLFINVKKDDKENGIQ